MPEKVWRTPIEFIRARFLVGIAFLAPFVITYVVLAFLFGFARDVFEPLFREWFGKDIPGLGFAILIGTPLLFGALALHFLGTRAMVAIESTAARLPIVGPVFAISHQMVSAFGGGEETGFQKVVSIEYPRKDMWSFGFLTRIVEYEDGRQLAMVYIPTTPTPNSGILVLVPLADVRQTDLRVNDLMKTVLSAGVAAPDVIRTAPLSEADDTNAAVSQAGAASG
jgi:uncharacterized membrane protein